MTLCCFDSIPSSYMAEAQHAWWAWYFLRALKWFGWWISLHIMATQSQQLQNWQLSATVRL